VKVKKDGHPAVRAEWTRLFAVKAAEEAKAGNSGRVVELNWKKRQVTIMVKSLICGGSFFNELDQRHLHAHYLHHCFMEHARS
jgi:hypothetical protein